jgi:ATP/maltotriose-dependent transcriptional regulator MalT
MLARAIEGLAMVTAGEIAPGMSRLDEAAAAAIAGEAADILARGWILCLVMDACDRVRDYDRAAQWCARARDFAASESEAGAMFYSFCRPHYAVVLMWRGEWEEAEVELVAAIDHLDVTAPPMAVEAVVRLAELRYRQGRWKDAAALFQRVESEPLAQLGRAELALSRDDSAGAVELAQRYLRRIPPNDRIERAAGLDVLVRALTADGRAASTAEPLEELTGIAEDVGTDALRASASYGHGLVAAARADFQEARRMMEDAVDAYRRAGAPFELGRARASLARSLRDDDRKDAAVAEARAAYDVLFALGALGETRSVVDLLREMGVETPEPAPPRARGPLTGREAEVLGLIAQGRSNQQIADALVLSIRTVERHISNIYGKIGAEGPGARAAATAYALGAAPAG